MTRKTVMDLRAGRLMRYDKEDITLYSKPRNVNIISPRGKMELEPEVLYTHDKKYSQMTCREKMWRTGKIYLDSTTFMKMN